MSNRRNKAFLWSADDGHNEQICNQVFIIWKQKMKMFLTALNI